MSTCFTVCFPVFEMLSNVVRLNVDNKRKKIQKKNCKINI